MKKTEPKQAHAYVNDVMRKLETSHEPSKPVEASEEHKLLTGEELLIALFPYLSRPTTRWLKTQVKLRSIPYIKIGAFVRFDLASVREALLTRHTVKALPLKAQD